MKQKCVAESASVPGCKATLKSAVSIIGNRCLNNKHPEAMSPRRALEVIKGKSQEQPYAVIGKMTGDNFEFG